MRMSSHLPIHRPHLAFVNASAQAAFATLDRVAIVGAYAPSVTYPNNGFALALRAVAGALAARIGTRVFWVQTGGYDTHAAQNTLNGTYADAHDDPERRARGVLSGFEQPGTADRHARAAVLRVRPPRLTRTAAAAPIMAPRSVMMAFGGQVRGGMYGTAPSLSPDPANPTLENGANDVRHETDFRSVYARVIDNWLGADSAGILGGDFRGRLSGDSCSW